MLYWAAVFFVIALIAALFGFFGIASTAAGVAKILFFVFLVLAVLALLFGRRVPISSALSHKQQSLLMRLWLSQERCFAARALAFSSGGTAPALRE